MPQPRSTGSDGSDNEGDGVAEQEIELRKLEQQYRLLENDRKAYTQESQAMIKTQKTEIKKLEDEHAELEKDMKLIESESNQAKNDKQCENLSELGRKKRDIEHEIEEEKKKQQELDAQIREMEKKVRKQQQENKGEKGGKGGSSGGGSGGGSDRNASAKKGSAKQSNARKLEDQLQLANNKFGKLLESNRALRKEIDDLRVERQRFDNLYKKLDKERQDLQQETNEIIDQSTQAYDQRVEAQEKMIMLNERAEKDVQQHNAEMKELIRIIDHDRKLREFMNTKSRECAEDPQLVKWRARKEAMEAEKKKAGQTDTVESYEAAFERIREITGEEDIDHIVRQFIEVEDENFALFNFVNDQNNKIEYLQEEIEQIEQQIKAFQNDGMELEFERQKILKELEERRSVLSKQADDYNARSTELSKVLDQVKAGINSLFTKSGCERTAIDDMLGIQEEVTDQNILQYLGIIEARTNQLLLTQAYLFKHKNDEEFVRKQPVLLGEGPQPHHHSPSIIPPAVGDEYDSDASGMSEDEKRPQTREQLMGKAMRSVVKREAAMKKQGFQYELQDTQDRSKKDRHGKQQKSIKVYS
jgi:chromosome segregation ATPase